MLLGGSGLSITGLPLQTQRDMFVCVCVCVCMYVMCVGNLFVYLYCFVVTIFAPKPKVCLLM
jgi:hypothetical protein